MQEPSVSDHYQLTELYLRRLSAQDAFIVYQKAVENVSFATLGKALSLSPNTVKSRFYRALRQLRKEFDADWTSPEGKKLQKNITKKRR